MSDETPPTPLAGQGEIRLVDPADRHTLQEWEAATAAVLRKSRRLRPEDPDAAVWETLTRTTYDGIAVAPLGLPEDLEGLHTDGRPLRGGPWDIRGVVDHADPKSANEAALVDLDNGVTSLWVRTEADLATVLDGVLLDLAPVVLDGARGAEAFLTLLAGRSAAPGTNLGADPLADGFAEWAERAAAAGVLAGVVDGTVLHDRGASDAQELGYALAVGAHALRLLTEAGRKPGLATEQAFGLLELRLAASAEQFPTIAKFRAARRLWTRIGELCGVAVNARIHAVTSEPMMSKYDPWVNMLRTTVAAFAAGVGGADAITVLPFDAPLGVPDEFGRRIARNTSSLLISESQVARVDDPAGGSYAVEKLTDELAVAAWAEFDRIEAAGGFVAALADGSIDARVAEVVSARDRAIATRQQPLTGLSEFPNLAEELPSRQSRPEPRSVVRRYGAAFEALRDAPVPTPVFLATLGSVAAHTARATFVSNLLAAGGIAVTTAGATSSTEDVLAAYGGQGVVCLAGPDPAYDEWGGDVIAALRAAGARHVIVAGRPGELDVDDSAALGVDALAFLTRTREAIR